MDAKGSIQKLGVSLNDKYSGENEALGLKTSGFRIAVRFQGLLEPEGTLKGANK